MRVLSLFDGISCGHLALDRAEIPVDVYISSEIDKTAMAITQKNYPNTVQVGDVTRIDGSIFGDIDLLLAGSPCQGFSVAGKGLNFSDDRSKLFFEFVRIKEECKPRYWLLENVSMKQEYEDLITSILGVKPVGIDSSDFSAQTRKRLYWTNLPIVPYESSPLVVEHILEDVVGDKYLIEPKRAVVVLDAEVKRRKIAYIGTDSQGNRIYGIHGKVVTLCGLAGGLGGKTGIYALPCLTPDRPEQRQNGRRFKPPMSKFYTLTALDRHGILTNNFIRRLTPRECERLQTVPDDYTAGFSDNSRYKALGNGWTVDVIAHIFKGLDR